MNEEKEITIYTHDNIKIETIVPIQHVTDIKITREFNEHGRLELEGVLVQEKASELIFQKFEGEGITILSPDEKADYGRVMFFSGQITEIEIIHQAQFYTVKLEALSATHTLDYQPKTRSFQNKDMYFADIIRKIGEDYPHFDFRMVKNDRPIGTMKLQYEETDWAFLRRLATHFNTHLIADVTCDWIPRFWFGMTLLTNKLDDVQSYQRRFDRDGYMRAKAQGLDVYEWEFEKYIVRSRDVLGLGEYAWLRIENML